MEPQRSSSISPAKASSPTWLGCELLRSLNFDPFGSPKLGVSREGTDWTSLLQVSVIYRLVAPGSEWRLHRQWYDQSAMKDHTPSRFPDAGRAEERVRGMGYWVRLLRDVFGYRTGVYLVTVVRASSAQACNI